MIINILLFLLFGAIVGWVAGLIMKSRNTLIVNIILGIVGALVGGFIASFVGIGGGASFDFSIVNIIVSIAGACLVVFVVGLIRKR